MKRAKMEAKQVLAIILRLLGASFVAALTFPKA